MSSYIVKNDNGKHLGMFYHNYISDGNSVASVEVRGVLLPVSCQSRFFEYLTQWAFHVIADEYGIDVTDLELEYYSAD